MYRQYKTTSTQYWNYRDNDKEGLTIKKPVAVELIKKILPNVKALSFEFGRTAFNKKGENHIAYLKEVLSALKVEYVEIHNSTQINELPPYLLDQPLHTFKLFNCPKLQDFSLLGQLKSLTNVHIEGGNYRMGLDFYKLPRLLNLTLVAKEIEDISHLPNLAKLRHLELANLNLEELPKGIENLFLLKTFKLLSLNKLTRLPSFKAFEKLEQFVCRNLFNLTLIPDDFDHLMKLKLVTLYNLGTKYETFYLPGSLCSNIALEELNIWNCPIKNLPNTFSPAAFLTKVSLNNLLIKSLPKTLSHLNRLEALTLQNCPELGNLNQTINEFKGLKLLKIENLPALKSFDFDFRELPALEKIFLKRLPEITLLPVFGQKNRALKEVEFHEMEQLSCLPVSMSHCKALESVRLQTLPIKEIPTEYAQFRKLKNFGLYGGPNLAYVPSALIEMGVDYLAIHNTPIQKEGFVAISDIVSLMKKKIAPSLHPIIAYWLFENYGKEPLTEKIRKGTLEALTVPYAEIQLLLEKNLHYLNEKNQRFETSEIQPKEAVAIIGTTQNKKTLLRQQLKELGFKYKTKVTADVKYVLVGKKPPIKEDFWESPRLLFTELAFVTYQKKHNPGLLQRADTPKEYIENLRQLIWSNDPANESIALELVINNGLPEGLGMDFIVAAKTGKDKKVRARIRRFLKANLADGAKQVLSDRNIMTGTYIPCYRYKKKITNSEIAQIVVAIYKRFGQIASLIPFFHYDDGSSPYRQELLTDFIPSLLEKPKYLRIDTNLTTTEINELLAHPIFQGKLERLFISSQLMKEIPEGVFKHQSIKNLELRGAFEAVTLPTELSSLYKLNKLSLHWDTLTHVPTEIGQLNRLREMLIYAKQSVILPDSFKQLTKLKRAYFSSGIEESVLWSEAMPTTKFK